MALVLALLPTPTGPRNKRQIAPSIEEQQPKRILAWFSANNHPQNYEIGTILSTEAFFDASQRLLLGDSATVVQINHPPDRTCFPPGGQIWHCRHHIVAKERQESSSPVGPDHLFNIFPFGNGHGQTFPSVFKIDFDKLPSSPWPLTIAGKTISLIDIGEQRGRGWPFPVQQPGVEITNYGEVIDYEWQDRWNYTVMTDAILRRRAKQIDDHFAAFFDNIRPVEVIFELLSQDLYVVLEDHIDIDGIIDEFPLPSGISKALKDGYSPTIRYITYADLGRPKPGAPCQQLAEGTVVDTTAYGQVRPGTLLHANFLPEEASPACWRTSGVVVAGMGGHRALISCGLPKFKGIWQGDEESVCYVGKVAASNVAGTSLSIIAIDGDESERPPLTNQVFDVMSGVVPELKRLRTSEDRLVHKIGYLNSPFTGNMEVTVVGHSVKFQQDGGWNPRMAVCDWLYTGQVEDNGGKVTPPDGTMGSAIFDEEGVVLGFWDCYIPTGLFAGMANAVSASELSGRGISLMPG